MGDIVAGRFQQQEQTERGPCGPAPKWHRRRCDDHFFVNPPGQHDRFPGGGDEDASPGARDAHGGAWGGATAGAVVGAAVGVAAASALGPIALVAAAGAGAVCRIAAWCDVGYGRNDAALGGRIERRSGMLVAVQIPIDQEQAVRRILEREGAEDIERASGTISDGRWVDFDPLRLVQPIAEASHPV